MAARLQRRALLAAALACLPGPGIARAQPVGFGPITVDVAPLRRQGLGAFAETVGATLRREIEAAFAGRRAPAGAGLVIRIDAVSLGSFAGGGRTRFGVGAGIENDYLEGEALVLGRRGEVLRHHPQLSVLPSSSGGAWYDPDSERRRIEAIARHFAGWLARDL